MQDKNYSLFLGEMYDYLIDLLIAITFKNLDTLRNKNIAGYDFMNQYIGEYTSYNKKKIVELVRDDNKLKLLAEVFYDKENSNHYSSEYCYFKEGFSKGMLDVVKYLTLKSIEGPRLLDDLSNISCGYNCAVNNYLYNQKTSNIFNILTYIEKHRNMNNMDKIFFDKQKSYRNSIKR